MYKTIEADIENGMVRTAEASRLPAHAHVLITVISYLPEEAKDFSAQEAASATLRQPHADIQGRVKVRGDIMNTVAAESWELPV
jgi:hypothetical protein